MRRAGLGLFVFCALAAAVARAGGLAAVCKDITVELDSSGFYLLNPSEVDGGSTYDDYAEVSPDTLDCSQAGQTVQVTLTVFNQDSTSDSCIAMVTVQDNTPPDVYCQNISAYLDESGTAVIVPGAAVFDWYDNCGIDHFYLDDDTFSCFDIGLNYVLLYAVDTSGNQNSCQVEVTVQDDLAPVVFCQAIDVYLDEFGTATITPEEVDAGSYDNCSIDTLYLDKDSFTCADLGVTVVTLYAGDPSGNVGSCPVNVTVHDNLAPVVVCQDITVYLDETGAASITPGDVDAGSYDNCFIDGRSLNIDTFTCANLGVNTVELSAADLSGNQNFCQAQVTVVDTLAPVIHQCPPAQGTWVVPGGQAAVPDFTPFADVADNCDVSPLVAQEPAAGTIVGEGTNAVQITVEDAGGNTNVCATSFVVSAIEPPSIAITGVDPLTIQFNTLTGGIYTVDYNDALIPDPQNWEILSNDVQGIDAPVSVSDPDDATNRNYRVRVIKP